MQQSIRSLRWSAALAVSLAAGACTKDESTPSAPTCTFSVSQPATNTFGPEGGTGSVAVTAGSGCSWTATSNAAFITITQGSSGSANGTVQFSVAANAGTDRTGGLAVAGTTVTLMQRGASAVPAVTLGAPVPRSPTGGTEVTVRRPTLVVDNAVASGNSGSITYRFEFSNQNAFPPNDILVAEAIPQGSGTTSWTLDRDLGPNPGTWYWRARATNGTISSDFSTVASFKTPAFCNFSVSPATVTAPASGGTATIDIGGGGSCNWTAASNASFITVTSGSSGSGNGSVTISIAANTGSSRNGTVTVAGQTVTVTQSGGGIVAGFRLLDPGTQSGPTTECLIRSATGVPTNCVIESTSFTLGTSVITSYAWTVRYTYRTERNLVWEPSTQSVISFTELCGQPPLATDDGARQPLQVTLTVTDSQGETATVVSGSGNQPALSLRLFNCGK
jgi:all-beta uncharacterized protein